MSLSKQVDCRLQLNCFKQMRRHISVTLSSFWQNYNSILIIMSNSEIFLAPNNINDEHFLHIKLFKLGLKLKYQY
jgi:hypothetical protein